KAECRFLARKLFTHVPRRNGSELSTDGCGQIIVAKQGYLAGGALGLLGRLHCTGQGRMQRGTIRLEHIECAGADECLDGPLVDGMTVDPAAEVEQICKATLFAHPQNFLDGSLAYAL